MQGERDIREGTAVWNAAGAVFEGQATDWKIATEETPPELRPLLQELRSLAEVIAAHKQSQRESEATATIGETWGPLVILEKIGEGAFGEVFRANEPRLDRQVALKFFRPHWLSKSPLTSDVIEEGRLLARVRHPNVVTVYGAKHLAGRSGIWMELIDGSTLEEIVEEHGPLSAREAVQIGRDLCGALAAVHEAGVLHRDIKARNVMREKSGRVVLMDLGVSCEVDSAIPVRQYGTPLYAAPEVLRDRSSSRRTDIYSLGVLLYFLVSGRYPVTGATLADIHEAHERGGAVSLAAVRPDLPADFVRIVDRALAGDRAERFATAAEMELALAEVLHADDRGRPAGFHTSDEEANNLYLRGRHFWNQRAGGKPSKALELFRKAVARDPEFALAHVGIAECLCIIGYFQYMRPRDAFAAARAAAESALTIDPDLGEAHVSLGWICWCHDWDHLQAEREYLRAIRLNPSYPRARQWYSLFLSSQGRYDEALSEVRACRELDPSAIEVAVEAVVLSHAGHLEEAVQLFRVGLETDPESLNYLNHMGQAYLFAGELDEAESCFRQAVRISKNEDATAVGFLAATLALLGRRDEAIKLCVHMEALAEQRYVSFFCRMLPLKALGRRDRWVSLLERSIAEREPYLVWVKTLGEWLPGYDDPAMVDRLREVGLMD